MRRATSLLVVGALAAGCSDSSRDGSAVVAEDAGHHDVNPVAATEQDTADLIGSFFAVDHQVELARIELASECLLARGLSSEAYREDARAELVRSASPRGATGLLPPLDPEVARSEGYPHLVNAVPAPSAGRIPVEVLEALAPMESGVSEIEIPGVATVGAKSEGCIADANRKLFGSLEGWLLVDQYVPASLRLLAGEALASADVGRAAAEYEQCMAAGGVAADNPAVAAQQARQRFGERSRDEAASRDELLMAKLDAACQATSRVHVEIDRVLGDLAAEWFRKNEPVVTDIHATRELARSIAACVMNSGREIDCVHP